MNAGESRVGRGFLCGAVLLAAALFGLATQAPGAASGRTTAGLRKVGPRIVFAHRSVLRSITPAGARGGDGTDQRTVLRAHGGLLYPQWVEAP